jgi:hypothetical protein
MPLVDDEFFAQKTYRRRPVQRNLQMNLSTFLEISDVKAVFRAEFEKPVLPIRKSIQAPPLSKSYGLTGTAFDYLFRFYLEKLNPLSISAPWAAELALSSRALASPAWKTKAKEMLGDATAAYQRYREQGEHLPDSILLVAAVQLAHLETVYRTGRIIPESFGVVDTNVTEDLRALFGAIRAGQFMAKDVCLLNPRFGSASDLVGHADADLILDDRLIDVKTNKDLEFDRTTFHQLLGYYCLFELGEVEGAPQDHQINTLGIYFARYGLLFSFPIAPIMKDKKGRFLKWFKQRAIDFAHNHHD